MIRETITFTFENEEQQKRFHERLKAERWKCAAQQQGTAGGNDPAECNWPMCGCDLYATKVVETLSESGWTSRDARREAILRELASETQKLGGMGY